MGSSANTPDIKVRLSADGVQDVINAFKRVNAEAKNIQPGGLSLLNSALGELKGLLPAITLGLVVQQVVSLGTEALNTVQSLVRMSQQTGVSAGTLSVFGLAAKETGVDMDAVGVAITRLEKASADAANGAEKPKKAFADLGITFQQLKTLSPDQLLVLVAQKLSAIESPATRAQAVVALFGRAGAQLIPLFKQIATEGFGTLTDKAKALGVYLGDDFEEKARLAKISMGDLSAAIQGAAMQFVNGAIPAIDGLAAALSALAGGGPGFEEFGKNIGAGVIYISSGFVSLVKNITIATANFDLFVTKARAAIDTAGAALSPTQAGKQVFNALHDDDLQREADDKNTINQAKIDASTAQKALGNAYDNINKPASAYKAQSLGSGVTGDGISPEQAAKDAAARSAFLQAQADNEIAILKTKNQIEAGEDERAYQQGLIALDEYYDARADRIAQTAEAEEEALNQKMKAAQAMPQQNVEQQYKRKQEIAKVQTALDENELKMQGDLRASEDERAQARLANDEKQLQVTKQLQEAEGDKEAAAQTGLQIELNAYEKLLKTQGLTVDQIKSMVAAYKEAGEAKIAFQENQKQASSISEDYTAATDLVDAQVGSGRITSYAGDVEKLNFQQEELDKLKAIGAQMTLNAAASKDPDAVAQAKAFNDSLTVQQEKLMQVTTAAVYLKDQLATEGRAALTDFFSSVIDGSKSAADAFKDLGDQFAKIVADMVAKLLVFYAIEEIVGFIAPDSNYAQQLQKAGPFGKFSSGGYTGDQPVNQVVGVVHGQEWVTDASTTKKYRPILEAMSAGTFDTQPTALTAAAVQSGMNLPAVVLPTMPSAGGQEDDADTGAGPAVQITVENHTGAQVTQQRTKGADGGEMIRLVIGAVQQDIASGGKIGTQIQQTYGVTRQGVKK